MAEQDSSVDTGEESVDTDPKGKDPDLVRAEKRRQSALKRAQEAEAELAKERAAREERDAELERSNGETSKVIERLERKLAKQGEELAGYKQQEQRQERRSRMDKFVDAISAKSGVANKARLRGLLREAGDTRDVDTSPEEFDDDLVVETIGTLKEIDGETFAPASGKSTPVAGQGVRTEPEDRRERIRRRAVEHAKRRGITTPS